MKRLIFVILFLTLMIAISGCRKQGIFTLTPGNEPSPPVNFVIPDENGWYLFQVLSQEDDLLLMQVWIRDNTSNNSYGLAKMEAEKWSNQYEQPVYYQILTKEEAISQRELIDQKMKQSFR